MKSDPVHLSSFNLQTFFKKFDQFADAPDAIAKMRELILDFAIGGRLLRNSESAELEANGGWPKQTLGSIASLITKGSTPTSYGHQYEASGIPFVKVENIADGVINRSSMEQFISEATHEFLKRSQLESGDILFSIAGTIGKTCVVSSSDVPANTNQALAIIRGFSASFEIPFLKMQLDSFVANKVKAKARGGAMPNVSLGDLRDLLVVVPPLAEQMRIVAKVDELMALCDRLERQQQERETRHAALARASLARFAEAPTPANLDFLFHPSYAIPPADLRKAILTLAVQGKLVPQDPNDKPAEDLIKRVSAALPDKKSGNPFLGQIDASIIDESEYELPYGWAWLPLGHVGIWATGCGFPTQYQGEAGKEFLFCKVSDMNLPGNEIEIHTTVHTIDAEVMKKIRARANPAGTVIFPKIGGAIATHKRRLVIKPTIIDNNCSGIQPIGLTDDRWLLLFMRNLDLTKYQSGTSVPAVSQSSLDPIRIGLPPLAEQRRIVAKVEQLMVLVDALETQLAASRATAAKLLAALVAELTAA